MLQYTLYDSIERVKERKVLTAKQNRLIDMSSRGGHEHAFLVAVDQDKSESLWSVEDSLSELGTLANTAGAEVVGTMIQRLHHPDVATYIGKGRAQELCDTEKELGFDIVIFDNNVIVLIQLRQNFKHCKRCLAQLVSIKRRQSH